MKRINKFCTPAYALFAEEEYWNEYRLHKKKNLYLSFSEPDPQACARVAQDLVSLLQKEGLDATPHCSNGSVIVHNGSLDDVFFRVEPFQKTSVKIIPDKEKAASRKVIDKYYNTIWKENTDQ